MSRWLKLLGSLTVWALHFVGLYTISSIADLYSFADEPVSRVVGLVFTLLCLGFIALIAVWITRSGSGEHEGLWERKLAWATTAVSGLAIAWQSIPLAF